MKKFLSCFILFFGLVFSIVGCGDKTVYHTVSFETGDLVSVESQKVADGELATEPSNINKEGYNFIGWFADSQLQSEFDFSQPIKRSTTIYAKLEKIEIEITFAQIVSGVEIVDPTEKTYYGDDYHFSILIEERFNQSEPNASMDGVLANIVSSEIITEEGNNKDKRKIDYCFENVKKNGVVSIGSVKQNQYLITLPTSQAGYELNSSTKNVSYNGEAKFTFKLDEKYNQSVETFKIILNKNDDVQGEDITNKFVYNNGEYTYTEKEIKAHLTISIEGVEINKFDVQNISDLDNDGKTFSVEWIEGVENGKAIIDSTIKFRLRYNEDYNRSTPTISAKMGEETITPTLVSKDGVDAIYKIENVVANISEIKIEGIKINIYSVTLPKDVEGVVFGWMNVSGKNMQAGSKLEVSVSKNAGYDFTNATVEYLGEKHSLANIQGKIVVDPLKDDVVFIVEGVLPILFEVAFEEVPNNVEVVNQTGFYKETNSILKTKTFTFELGFAEGYELGNIKVYNNDSELIPAEGIYSVENVSSNINISFTGEANLKTYNVEIEMQDGIAAVNEWVGELTHGSGSDGYKLTISELYSDCFNEVQVFANGETLTKNANLEALSISFAIENIKENITITLSNLERNKVAVEYIDFDDCASNYFLKDEDGNVFTSKAEVHKSYDLYLYLKSEYNDSRNNIKLTFGGSEYENDSVFDQSLQKFVVVFKNIEVKNSEIKLTLSGYEKNIYSVSYQDKNYSVFNHFEIELLNGNSVVHGGTVEFKVLIDENYEAKVDYSELVTITTATYKTMSATYDDENNKFVVENVQESITISIEYYEDSQGVSRNKIDYIKYSLDVYVEGEFIETIVVNSGSVFEYVYESDFIEVVEWQSADVDINNIKGDGKVYSKKVENIEYNVVFYYDMTEHNVAITHENLHFDSEREDYYYILTDLENGLENTFIGWNIYINGKLFKPEEGIPNNRLYFSNIMYDNVEIVAKWSLSTPKQLMSFKSDNQIIFEVGYDNVLTGDYVVAYNWYGIEEDGTRKLIETTNSETFNLVGIEYSKVVCVARVLYDDSASADVESEEFEIK